MYWEWVGGVELEGWERRVSTGPKRRVISMSQSAGGAVGGAVGRWVVRWVDGVELRNACNTGLPPKNTKTTKKNTNDVEVDARVLKQRGDGPRLAKVGHLLGHRGVAA